MQRGAGKLQRQGLDEGSEEPDESESRVKEKVSRPRDSWRLPLGLGARTPTARAACRGRAGGRKWRGRAGWRTCARGRAGSLWPARQTSAPVRASLSGADCFQSGLPSGRDFKRDSHAGQTDLKFPVG
ncbi:cell cycle regulator of non-homologous end joining isoform X2 [Acinonyx jubatus]|uniref:Cell cycle regulator of non-homologous end joining isoform X2 n=1 Tax=Acinonyx jubatus TaxID=32536 RepID=A0A6J2AS03_ACIJB|nr:cell cycle regulator of non-homologous end joining isoform X2 [Acinonyx jubatus]